MDIIYLLEPISIKDDDPS